FNRNGTVVITKHAKLKSKDITFFPKYNEETKQFYERFRHVIDNFPLYIILLNEKGVILNCNKHIHQLFGFNKEEYIGKSFIEIKNLNLTKSTFSLS
ncbi:MAG: PAS domain-containing protein, partial [Promethearchaeota archaeon]